MAVIDESVVRILPDFTGFRTALNKGIKQASAGATVTVEAQLSTTKLRKQLESLQARWKPKLVFTAVLATGELRRQVAHLKRTYNPKLVFTAELNTGELRRKVARMRVTHAASLAVKVDKASVAKAEDAIVEEVKRFRTRLARDPKTVPTLGLNAQMAAASRLERQRVTAVTQLTRAEATREKQRAAARAKAARDEEAACRNEMRRARNCEEQKAHVVRMAHEAALREYEAREKRAAQNSIRGRIAALRGGGAADMFSAMAKWDAPKFIDWGGKGLRPMQALLLAVVALTPALLAMAGSAVQAGTAVTALGAAAVGTAGLIVGLFSAFRGVGEALDAAAAARKSEVTSTTAATRAQATNAAAVRSAGRAYRDASRAVVAAQRAEADAQAALNEERAQAVRDLTDLREMVSDLARDEQGATLALARAREDAAEVNANFWATDLERAEAAHSVAEAEDRLSDIQRDRGDTAAELAKAERAGIRNAPRVVAARRALADATEATARAQENAQEAAEGIAQAQATAAEAMGETSAAAAVLADELSKLSPAGLKLFNLLDKKMRPAWEDFRRATETAFLPGFTLFLERVSERSKGALSTLDLMGQGILTLGRITSTAVGRLGRLMQSGWFRRDVVKLNQENAKAFGNLARAAEALVRPIMRITVRSAPLLTRFTGYLEKVAVAFDKFIERAEATGDLGRWFQRAGDELAKWWSIAVDLGRILLDIFTTSLPTGSSLVDRLKDFVAGIREWTSSEKGQESLRKFFKFFQDIDYGKMARTIGSVILLVSTLKGLKMAANHPFFALMALLATQFPQQTADVLELAADSLIGLLKFAHDHPVAAGSVLAILTGIKAASTFSKLGFDIPGLGKLMPKSVATMNVAAGTVNIVGGKGGGALLGGRAKGVALLGGGAIATALILGVIQAFEGAKHGFEGRGNPLTSAIERRKQGEMPWSDLFNMFSPVYWANWGISAGLTKWFEVTKGPREWLFDIGKDVADGLFGGFVEGIKAFGDWVKDTLKKLVGDTIARALGVASPSTLTMPMGADLVLGLWTGFTTTLTELAGQWQDWLTRTLIKPVTDAMSSGAAGIVTAFLTPFTRMVAALDAPIRAALNWINAHLIAPVNTLLAKLRLPDDLRLPTLPVAAAGPPTPSSAGVTRPGAFAGGGLVPGVSPNPRADDKYARVTSYEYVQPVSAVRYYGPAFMDAIRDRKIPRMAGGGMLWPHMWGWVSNRFPGASLTSSYRQGDPGYHGRGQAIDLVAPGVTTGTGMAAKMFNAIKGAFYRNIAELIWDFAGSKAVWNGREHYFTGPGAGPGTHADHIHFALHRFALTGGAPDSPLSGLFNMIGGFVGKFNPLNKILEGLTERFKRAMPDTLVRDVAAAGLDRVPEGLYRWLGERVSLFDQGGLLAPGVSVAVNRTGAPETVRTAAQEAALAHGGPVTVRLDHRDLRTLAAYIVAAAAGRPVELDGRRVAEGIHAYDLLPVGV